MTPESDPPSASPSPAGELEADDRFPSGPWEGFWLQPVLDSLTSQVWFGGNNQTRPADNDSRGQMGDRISQVSLPVTVELGDAELTVQALLELQEGHLLKLNTNANGPLPIRVDDRVKFVGQAGLSGKNLAVQIVRAVAQEG